MTILDRLADYARRRTEQAKRKTPLAALERQALSMPKGGFAFEAALKKPGLSFICECKRASPSKGLIAPAYPYLQIAGEYEAAGADAVSVLTEPKWFLGSDEHLKEIAGAVSVPCLRKDFTVDAYMIYEARLLGASAVLLICAILTDAELRAYLAICDALGLSALVEAHEEREVRMALDAGARVIGVNNRSLRDFTVDVENSRRLREQIPPEVLFVSESGVRDAGDIRRLRAIGADAVRVFVDEKPETVARLMNRGVIDMAQLHGSETEDYVRLLRTLTDKPLLQAFRIHSAPDCRRAAASSADYVLLDSGAGTGRAFDWKLVREVGRPYFLAGGLDAENVGRAVLRLHPYAVDVSSGIETDGSKDRGKMEEFVRIVREADGRGE